MPANKDKEQETPEEQDIEEEEAGEEVEGEAEEEEEVPQPRTGGPTWGFWRMLFALLILAIAAGAIWFGWQYMVAQKERAREMAAKEAETKKHLLLVTQKLRAATDSGAQGDLDAMLDDLEGASEALSLAKDITIDDMRPALDGLQTRIDAAKQSVQDAQARLKSEAEKEAKAASEAVSGAMEHAQSIVKQQYAPEEGGLEQLLPGGGGGETSP